MKRFCIYCGKELVERNDLRKDTWDANRYDCNDCGVRFTQWQESNAYHVTKLAKGDKR